LTAIEVFSVAQIWWVFLIIGLLLLLIIIAVLLYFYCKDNEGDVYPGEKRLHIADAVPFL
jgi:hypothetical protein